MGLWHGANWTFALWGLWHATMVWLHRATGPVCEKLPMPVRRYGGWAFTIGFAMLGWIFFRARTVHDSLAMIGTAFNPARLGVRALRENDYLVAFCVLVGMLLTAGLIKLGKSVTLPGAVRYPAMAAASAVMFFGVFLCLRQVQQFIYFQF
jgi:D-alanyl-lipoteichoic acid acyltransferase DltB (MBOAT superfamily)